MRLPDQPLQVALVQATLQWENADANHELLADMLDELGTDCDLAVLPEMFASGFSMHAEHISQPMDGPSVSWLREQAATRGKWLMGSLAIAVDGGFRNRLLLAGPNGELDHYDKRHLFTLAGEHRHYQAGEERVLMACGDWQIRGLVCYDLRFPVWCRGDGEPIQVYVANWPAPRHQAWRSLLQARAIENQSYVIGVNRVGKDGYGHDYLGGSVVYDPRGDILVDAGDAQTTVSAELSAEDIKDFRDRFDFLADRDAFALNHSSTARR